MANVGAYAVPIGKPMRRQPVEPIDPSYLKVLRIKRKALK